MDKIEIKYLIKDKEGFSLQDIGEKHIKNEQVFYFIDFTEELVPFKFSYSTSKDEGKKIKLQYIDNNLKEANHKYINLGLNNDLYTELDSTYYHWSLFRSIELVVSHIRNSIPSHTYKHSFNKHNIKEKDLFLAIYSKKDAIEINNDKLNKEYYFRTDVSLFIHKKIKDLKNKWPLLISNNINGGKVSLSFEKEWGYSYYKLETKFRRIKGLWYAKTYGELSTLCTSPRLSKDCIEEILNIINNENNRFPIGEIIYNTKIAEYKLLFQTDQRKAEKLKYRLDVYKNGKHKTSLLAPTIEDFIQVCKYQQV